MSSRHASSWTFVVGLVALLGCAVPTRGQIRGSERSRISQTSDGTTVTLDYGRPQVRGRSPVFGELIEWGHVWTPGANWATTFEVDHDVEIGGTPVPAGRYSMWFVPGEDSWELVLDPDDRLYHTQGPARRPEQIRMRVTPERAEHTEALTFDFPTVDPGGMVMRFAWDDRSLPLRIDVPSSMSLTVAADEAERYTGAWEITFEGPPPEGAPPGAAIPAQPMEIWLEGDRLLGEMRFPGAPPTRMQLLPAAEGIFKPGWLMDGELFEVEMDMYFEFELGEGRATAFAVRGLEDSLMARGTRAR